MDLGFDCQGATFKSGETYDFYIINLTDDEHPMHIHLLNFQIIGRFKFNVAQYQNDWQNFNGMKPGPRGFARAPKQLDVRPYRTSPIESYLPEEEAFLDVIPVPVGSVTIARVKFVNTQGKKFPFDIRGSRYVWHCHILEHEDNEMMRWFCI